MRIRNLVIGGTLLALFTAFGTARTLLERRAEAQAKNAVMAPMFEVDPLWPKPLPHHWLLGSTIGVSVGPQDHIWIIHRGAMTLNRRTEMGAATDPKTAQECCIPAPPILEFDQAGNLLNAWGGPGQGYEWPESNHGITVDYKGNVWIGGNGRNDSQILKFTEDGKFLMQFGHSGARRVAGTDGKSVWQANSNDTENFGRVAKIFVDPATNEAYIADGYLNHRVAVIDADTGKFKRYWGAYGHKPTDARLGPYDPDAPPAQEFRNPVHCAMLSHDDLVYVCDRPNDRIQVFRKDGTFVKEKFIARKTLGDGSVWDITFSRDPEQKYLYLADGKNEKVYILDRQSLEILTSFGDGGRQPGEFFAVHSIATDSKGNLYTTETYEGKRVQKFVYKGLGPVTTVDQGVLWPKTSGTPGQH